MDTVRRASSGTSDNRNTTATQPQHNRNTTATQPQHNRNTTATQPQHNRNTTATQPQHNRNTTETQPNTLHPPRGSLQSSYSHTGHSVTLRRSFEPASPTKARAFSAFVSAIRCASNPQASSSTTVKYMSGYGACSRLHRAALALRFLLRAVSVARSFFPPLPFLTSTKRYACVIRLPPPECPEPVLSIARSLEACFASSTSSSTSQYHVLCTHQDQVMQLSEGTYLLAGNDACKHGMVRWYLILISSPFFLVHSPGAASICLFLHSLHNKRTLTLEQLAYAANAISLQGNCCLCACHSTRLCESHEKRSRVCRSSRVFA
jgi:hypothetical protein